MIRCLLLVVFVFASSSTAETISPDDDRIRYVGRWERSNAKQPWCAWQSSSFKLRFQGSGLNARIRTEVVDYVRVIIDGDQKHTKKIKISSDEEKYELAAGLDDSEHTVEVVKETYGGEGRMTLQGLEVTEGRLLDLAPAGNRLRIEFFGDSNLAGYSLEDEKNKGGIAATGCHFTFAGITARMLDADYQNTSVSGAIIAGRKNSVMSFYDRVDFYHAEPRFEFASFPADICVINIGANDINGKKKDQIKADYKKLLAAIRKVRPTSHIVLMNADGWSRDEPANYTSEVIEELNDDRLTRLVFPWYFNEWHGCEYDHAGMAQRLVDHLTKVNPQWKPVRPSDVMDGFGHDGDVANGSFEHEAPFGGYGWRYFQDGAQRVRDPDGSANGSWFLRLPEAKGVHQPNATTPGQKHRVRLKVRSLTDAAKAIVRIEFRDQDWRNEVPNTAIEHTIEPDAKWNEFSIEFTSPDGPVEGDRSHAPWKYLLHLKSAKGVVDFDDVHASALSEPKRR